MNRLFIVTLLFFIPLAIAILVSPWLGALWFVTWAILIYLQWERGK